MKTEKLAKTLNGREYGNEITSQEEKEAKENSLVVVYGYSDDNIELRGAIDEEVGGFGGTTIHVGGDGSVVDMEEIEHDCSHCSFYKKLKGQYHKIEALYGEEDFTWSFKTEILHHTFDIFEDGDKFCKGIVFSLNDLKDKLPLSKEKIIEESYILGANDNLGRAGFIAGAKWAQSQICNN